MANNEFTLCCGLMKHMRDCYPATIRDYKFFAIPNGEYRDQNTGAKLKRSGVLKGVSDYLLTIPSGGYIQLWLEIKTETGRLKPEQKAFLRNHTNDYELGIVTYGYAETIRVVDAWMKGRAKSLAWMAGPQGKRERNEALKREAERQGVPPTGFEPATQT